MAYLPMDHIVHRRIDRNRWCSFNADHDMLIAVGLMLLWSNIFQAVFWVAVIPGAMAVALLAFGVK